LKTLKIILLSLTPLLMYSCNEPSYFPFIKGSGIIVKEKRDTDNFSSIDLRMAGNAGISEDDRFKVLEYQEVRKP
jgi:hypothetical protein